MKPQLRSAVEVLLRAGAGQHEISRRTRVDRKTVRRIQRESNSPILATGSGSPADQIPPPRPPAPEPPRAPFARSACEPHRDWIQAQLVLGRNATSIFQDLVESHGFSNCYNSVKRYVARLRAREPERFDVLEFLPGEEAQVDYGQGAPTLYRPGKYRRPYLFVMTLKYSGKSFRKVLWKTDQETWARLHEQAFRALGGCPQYVVLDNLKEGVIRPDIYAPELNPVYAAMLAHYGVVADPCRVRDPNRKGSVENAIGHTQGTALKGRRFDSLDEQNGWLAHWEERWAAPRIHGRKKRQVLEMYHEEQSHLRALPLEGFRYFRQVKRTVDDGGLVQVVGSYYAAAPAVPYSEVTVRLYEHEIEILDDAGTVLRRHARSTRKGAFVMEDQDRIFNPSRETARLLAKVERIGPRTATLAREIFARLGRPGQRAIYGLASLTRRYARKHIEAICNRMLEARCVSYAAVRRALERRSINATGPGLSQAGPQIRSLTEYQAFWDEHSGTHSQEDGTDGNVYH